jgi:D-glycero-alpha-D-manno-heptose-7-phosphate kinase
MIITKTPFRMSFLGGGSDLPGFYQQSPGATLSVTINKYMYISSHDFFERNQFRMKYSKTETVDSVAKIEHPILRRVIERLDIKGGLEVSSISDIPSGTGLGSSSCFTVGVLHNLYSRQGRFVTKEQIAREACEVEIQDLGEPIGKQDQYAAAYGGLNVISYSADERVKVEPLFLNPDYYEAFQEHLMLFYTGKNRSASAILSEQKANMMFPEKIERLKKMVELVSQGRETLHAGRFEAFGDLLHQGWVLKKGMARGVSSSDIDTQYQLAMDNGAFGGKVLGAGGGGFLLVCCPPEKREQIAKVLESNGMDHRPFRFENDGSKVIYAEQ